MIRLSGASLSGALLALLLAGCPGQGLQAPSDLGVPGDGGQPDLPVTQPLIIDGLMDDWAWLPPAYEDARGDGGEGVDLARLWLADDDRFLYLRLDVGAELDLNEGNDLIIYIDTDGDASTGLAMGGLGADLEWSFGERSGLLHQGNRSRAVSHRDLKFRAEPTVSSRSFEMVLGREMMPPGGTIALMVGDREGGDQIPEEGEALRYTMDRAPIPSPAPIPLGRSAPPALRLVTYNVLFDSPWLARQGERFGRILAALDPDVISFQEIADHSAEETALLVEGWIPGPWFFAEERDCKVVSRYPIVEAWALDGNLAVLIDAVPALGSRLLLVNAHLPCCEDDGGRQWEADQIMGFVRDARQDRTPLVLTGDLNLVGSSRPLTTLVEGTILHEYLFGQSFGPDGDGTALTSLAARHTEVGMGYTWISEGEGYWPSHLDYLIYSDSLLEIPRAFILDTREMSLGALATHGLEADDSLASDHLPLCADLRLIQP